MSLTTAEYWEFLIATLKAIFKQEAYLLSLCDEVILSRPFLQTLTMRCSRLCKDGALTAVQAGRNGGIDCCLTRLAVRLSRLTALVVLTHSLSARQTFSPPSAVMNWRVPARWIYCMCSTGLGEAHRSLSTAVT